MLLFQFVGDGDDGPIDGLHLPGPGSSDYTLCGLSTDGDVRTVGSFRNVEAKAVTCHNCVAIILCCRGVMVAPNGQAVGREPGLSGEASHTSR